MDGITFPTSTSHDNSRLFLSDFGDVLSSGSDAVKRFLAVYVMKEVDWTTMMLLFWVIFGLFVYAIGNILSIVIKKRKEDHLSESSLNKELQQQNDSSVCGNADGQKKYDWKHSSLPRAIGPDEDCVDWINRIIEWVLTKNSIVSQSILNIWISSLNEKAKSQSKELGFLVEFVKVIEEQSSRPELSNIKTDLEHNQNVTTTCKICTPKLTLIVNVRVNENGTPQEDFSQYEILLERLEARVKVACISEESLLVVRCVERPDVKVSLRPKKNPQKTARQDAVIDVILNSITNSVSDLCFSGFADFPKFQRKSGKNQSKILDLERKIFVKIVKAENLGGKKGCSEPYCVIEVDDPPQRSQTSIIKGTASPTWNEHFIFNLENDASELLFEVYDRSNRTKNEKGKFLGLAIVSVAEMKNNPSQKQTIVLQARPLEDDAITGTLTVEFLFMEHSNRPLESTINGVIETNSKVTATGTLITTTTIRRPENEEVDVPVLTEPVDAKITTGDISTAQLNGETEVQNGLNEVNLKETALKEVEGKYIIPNANKSTLIIHSVQRKPLLAQNKSSENGSSEGYGTGRTTPSSQNAKIEAEGPSGEESASTASQKSERTSRSRSKESRSIIKAIRKRFSFSKNRSKSVEHRIDQVEEPTSRDSSVSSDRARSVPNSREPSSVKELTNKTIASPKNGKLESLSNLSEISGYSTRTFVHEKSMLVIETTDNSIVKHYVVPLSLAHKSKWRRRGVKLHLYNGHTFVAKHLSGSITCHVCGKLFSRRPGKQGYECRDCNQLCHKRCHIYTEITCPSSQISSMEFEHVVDPKATKTSIEDKTES